MNPLIQDDFSEITQLIAAARQRAVQAVNTTLIDLYFSSNWGAISVLSAANIRCKWAGGTSRWICCFSIRPRHCCKPSCTNSICRTRRTTIPKTQPEPPNSLVQKYRLSEKSSKLMTPLTTSKRENHVPNSSHSNRPGRLSWQAIHSGYSCASRHRCRQPGRRYVNRGCTTGIRFDSRRYPGCLGVRQRFGAAGIFP